MVHRTSGFFSPFQERPRRSGSSPMMTFSVFSSVATILCPGRVRGDRSMRGLVAALGIPLLLTLTLAARGQAPKAAPPKAVQQKSSFVDRVLSFLGISDSPGTLKGPGDEVSSGELWLVDLESQTRRAIAPGRHYRSPV